MNNLNKSLKGTIMNFNQLVKESVEEYNALFEGDTPVILVGSATCGKSAGAQEISVTFKEELEKQGVDCSSH